MNLEPLVSNALNFPYSNAVQFSMGEGSTFTTNFCPKNPALALFYGVTGGQNGANNPPRSLSQIQFINDPSILPQNPGYD